MHRNHDLSVSQTMRLIARCPTKTDLEFTFLERFNMLVHNILITRHHDVSEVCLSTTSGNPDTINHVRGSDKPIHNQPGTIFAHLIWAK